MTVTWDRSVLGLDPAEVADMERDEQVDRVHDELNRAHDIIEATIAAFGSCLGAAEVAALESARTNLLRVTRGVA